MTEHKEVETVAYAYYRLSNRQKVLSHTAISKENWPVNLTKPLGIIEPNTTTIPTEEYKQLKADAERYRFIRPSSFSRQLNVVNENLFPLNDDVLDEAIDQARSGA